MGKGFIFTVDSLNSLAAISLLALAYLVISSAHPEMHKYSMLESQGRDYLRLNFFSLKYVDRETFEQLTGHGISTIDIDVFYDFSSPSEISDFAPLEASWNWTPSNGGGMNSSGGSLYYQSVLRTFDAQNYSIQANITWGNDADAYMAGGVGGRANSSGARYTCVLQGDTAAGTPPAGHLSIYALRDWSSCMTYNNPGTCIGRLSSGSIEVWENEAYSVRMELIGTTINCRATRLSTGETQSVSATDSRYERGFVTLEGKEQSGSVIYDDILITSSDRAEPLMLKGILHNYYPNCGCMSFGICIVLNGNACLNYQENLRNAKKEVWVE